MALNMITAAMTERSSPIAASDGVWFDDGLGVRVGKDVTREMRGLQFEEGAGVGVVVAVGVGDGVGIDAGVGVGDGVAVGVGVGVGVGTDDDGYTICSTR